MSIRKNTCKAASETKFSVIEVASKNLHEKKISAKKFPAINKKSVKKMGLIKESRYPQKDIAKVL